MSEPTALHEFSQALQNDPSIIIALAESEISSFDEFLASGSLEDCLKEEASEVDTIEAAGGCEHYFNIEIQSFGPVFWIQANEFDDIGYFGSENEAVEYARREYAVYIETFEQLEAEAEDEEEE